MNVRNVIALVFIGSMRDHVNRDGLWRVQLLKVART